jgi:hypothetical protein
MQFVACGLVLLALSPAFALKVESSVSSSLTFDAESAKNRPVSKVITLLKDMSKQLEKEADEDQDIYDKMACWCKTNEKDKKKSIADARSRVSDLTTKIEEFSASSSRLNTEVKNLKKEVSDNQEALDKATGIRQKELAEFNAEEKDLLQSISSLKAAVTVLARKGSFLQIPRESLQNLMQRHESLLSGVITHSERRAVAAFMQAPSYAPQGGEIFGILRQMQESFETNLASSQKEEGANQKAYESLKQAKEAEIKAGQEQKADSCSSEVAGLDPREGADAAERNGSLVLVHASDDGSNSSWFREPPEGGQGGSGSSSSSSWFREPTANTEGVISGEKKDSESDFDSDIEKAAIEQHELEKAEMLKACGKVDRDNVSSRTPDWEREWWNLGFFGGHPDVLAELSSSSCSSSGRSSSNSSCSFSSGSSSSQSSASKQPAASSRHRQRAEAHDKKAKAAYEAWLKAREELKEEEERKRKEELSMQAPTTPKRKKEKKKQGSQA